MLTVCGGVEVYLAVPDQHMDTGDANTGHSVHSVNLGGKLAATRTQTWYCTSYQVDI